VGYIANAPPLLGYYGTDGWPLVVLPNKKSSFFFPKNYDWILSVAGLLAYASPSGAPSHAIPLRRSHSGMLPFRQRLQLWKQRRIFTGFPSWCSRNRRLIVIHYSPVLQTNGMQLSEQSKIHLSPSYTIPNTFARGFRGKDFEICGFNILTLRGI
jgi:hypothetical protein